MYSYRKCTVLRSYFFFFLLWSTFSKGRPGHVPRPCGHRSLSTQAQNMQQCNMRYPTLSTSFTGVSKWSAFGAVTFAKFKVETRDNEDINKVCFYQMTTLQSIQNSYQNSADNCYNLDCLKFSCQVSKAFKSIMSIFPPGLNHIIGPWSVPQDLPNNDVPYNQ
jgi:hypothetical protein